MYIHVGRSRILVLGPFFLRGVARTSEFPFDGGDLARRQLFCLIHDGELMNGGGD